MTKVGFLSDELLGLEKSGLSSILVFWLTSGNESPANMRKKELPGGGGPLQ
jgi:hypothetical protein